MRFARHSPGVFALVTCFALATSFAYAVTLVPDPVKTGPKYQVGGTGNADYFAWSSNGLWVDPTVGSSFKVNESGQADSVDQTEPLLSWTRFKNGTHVKLFDMSTMMGVELPSGINTNKYVCCSGVFGNTFTFIRGSTSGDKLFLVTDLSTGEKINVTTFDPSKANYYGPPRLYGNWIVWSTITQSGWKAYRYDITNDLIQKIPNPTNPLHHKWYYAPSVDVAGNVYFIRSGHSCGASLRLMKWDGNPLDNPVVTYSFDPGIDVVNTSVYDDGAGSVTVYVDFLDCLTGDSDIYSFTNP